MSIFLFLPYAVPSVVAVVLWRFWLEDHGALAVLAGRILNIPATIWMGDWIFWTLVMVSVWQFYPFVFVTVLAQMRRIPPALYQSAQLDGANAWQQFWFVTFPQIRPTLLTVLALRAAFMFTKFDTPWLLGGRTANLGLTTLPVYIYDHRLLSLKAAGTPGVAAGVVMAAALGLVMAGALFIHRTMQKWRDNKNVSQYMTYRHESIRGNQLAGRRRPLSSERPLSIVLKTFVVASLVGILAFSFVPYLSLLVGSLLPNASTDRGIGATWPTGWTLANHFELLGGEYHRYWQYLINTVIVSNATAVLVLCLSILGAFGLTRYELRGRKFFEQAVYWGYLFPPIVLVFPYAVLLQSFGLNGTKLGLILANVAFCFPFGLWLMIRYLMAVPKELDRTAAADGACWWQTLWYVIIRRALPGIGAIFVFSFILSWNDVALSLVLGTGDTKTLAAGVKESILDVEESRYSTFAAASLWVATLAAVIFGLLQAWIDSQLRAEAEEMK